MTIDRSVALGIEQVLKELKIDETQGATIRAALQAYQERRREARPNRSAFQFLSDEEQQELRKKNEEANRKGDETLAALLEPERLKRLDQIVFQAQLRFSPAETVRRKLELTEDQLKQLQGVEDDAGEKQLEMRSEVMKRFQGGGEVDRAEIHKIFETYHRKVEAATLAVLTESQNTTITELKGEEFKIDMRSLMGRRGRGGRDRQRGGDGERPRRQRPPSDDK